MFFNMRMAFYVDFYYALFYYKTVNQIYAGGMYGNI